MRTDFRRGKDSAHNIHYTKLAVRNTDCKAQERSDLRKIAYIL